MTPAKVAAKVMGNLIQEQIVNNALKVLVAVACIAVIVIAAVWWSDRSFAVARAKQVQAAVSDAKEEEYKRDCLQMVDAWDHGRRAEVINRLGSAATGIVDDCRWFWDLPKP